MNKLSFQSSKFLYNFYLEVSITLHSQIEHFSEDINQIKDSLWFHMYDEMIEDIPSNDESMLPATEIYQKISSHFLGELIIPFSTIFASQRVCFELYVIKFGDFVDGFHCRLKAHSR